MILWMLIVSVLIKTFKIQYVVFYKRKSYYMLCYCDFDEVGKTLKSQVLVKKNIVI
jgi:hypothetical protein